LSFSGSSGPQARPLNNVLLSALPDLSPLTQIPFSVMNTPRQYLLTDSQIAQILYCMESMQSDYTDGTPDAADYESALAAIQSPIPSQS